MLSLYFYASQLDILRFVAEVIRSFHLLLHTSWEDPNFGCAEGSRYQRLCVGSSAHYFPCKHFVNYDIY